MEVQAKAAEIGRLKKALAQSLVTMRAAADSVARLSDEVSREKLHRFECMHSSRRTHEVCWITAPSWIGCG